MRHMLSKIIVAGVQMDVSLGDASANLKKILAHMEAAATRNARLVVFPECAVSGYCHGSMEEALTAAEPVPGDVTDRLVGECRRLSIHVVVGMLEGVDGSIYNSAVLMGPDGVVATYRKTHLPDLGVDKLVRPGMAPYQVHDLGFVRVGILICYDASFPEATRTLALAGADLIVLPTNWPPGAERNAEVTVPARSLENHVYFMAVNRVGEERGFSFIGLSGLTDPSGTFLERLEHRREEIFTVEINPEFARDKLVVRVPGEHEIHRLRDRRPDLYGPVVEDSRTR